MKPYTASVRDSDNLRKNWRGNKNYWRKIKDRVFKKIMRRRMKQFEKFTNNPTNQSER